MRAAKAAAPVIALVVAVCFGAACNPGAVYEPVGITRPRDDTQALTALYLTCGDEKVRRVTLFENGPEGPQRDSPLWSIEALDSGANAPEYVIGRSPPGFLPKVALAQPPNRRADLLVEFDTTKGTSQLEFTPADVEAQKVTTRNTEGEQAVLQPEVFGARSQRLCAS